MGSRTWIKIYCDKWLTGTLRDESPKLRGLWTDVLALAGNLTYGDVGKIGLPNNIPLSDDQIAAILRVNVQDWIEAKQRLIDTDRIRVENNVIIVSQWQSYQSEYQRQKPVRKVTAQSYTQKLHLKVLGEGEGEGEGDKEKKLTKRMATKKKTSPSEVKTMINQNVANMAVQFSTKPKDRETELVQLRAETIVEHYKARFAKGLNYGIVKRMLTGSAGYPCTDMNCIIEFIDRMPLEVQDPVARLCDMVKRPDIYLANK